MHQNQSVFFLLSCYRIIDKIFKMKINTLVTKYTDIITFNFVHTFDNATLLEVRTINIIFVTFFNDLVKYNRL